MSLIFKPRISFSFGSGRQSIVKNKPAAREEIIWSEDDLQKLVVLRALRCTYKECRDHFSRPIHLCSEAVHVNGLEPRIKDKRKEILAELLK